MSNLQPMTLSIDLDNKWSYLKTHGSPNWQHFPSYFDCVVPRILNFLEQRNLRITFFVVGQDAALEKNHQALQMIRDAGHEIANHSFNHEPWLHLYSEPQINDELERAEEAIATATGVQVNGFRGPGFSLSASTLSVLKKRHYAYDATAFPNILNPLARAYFFATSNLTGEEKERRKGLFGSYTDAFRPVKPYRWALPDGELLELPVTTMPVFKTPVHFSYLVYLASISPLAAKTYLRLVISMCRLTGTAPSLLLHPLEFMGCDDDRDLGFFPAMSRTSSTKLEWMDAFFTSLLRHFTVEPIGAYLAKLEHHQRLQLLQPNFAHRAMLANADSAQS